MDYVLLSWEMDHVFYFICIVDEFLAGFIFISDICIVVNCYLLHVGHFASEESLWSFEDEEKKI